MYVSYVTSRMKDETKLKQWRVDWDVIETETMETCPNIDDNSAEFGHGDSEEKDIMKESLEITKTKREDDKKEIEIKIELDVENHDGKHIAMTTNVQELIERDGKPSLSVSMTIDSKTTEELGLVKMTVEMDQVKTTEKLDQIKTTEQLNKVVDGDKVPVAASDEQAVKAESPVGEGPDVKESESSDVKIEFPNETEIKQVPYTFIGCQRFKNISNAFLYH